MQRFSFQLEKAIGPGGTARAGTMHTEHGVVQTPIFMPVGTQATVKALDSEDVRKTKAQIILANTYHLYLRPGTEVLVEQGGVHRFMQWPGPMLTDSGGFQVFSLGAQAELRSATNNPAGGPPPVSTKIGETGVEFSSYLDGSKHFFSPEGAIEIQRKIGADIIMAFDECTPDESDLAYADQALHRTLRWAAQCQQYWEAQQRLSVYGTYQALFGIIQGARHRDLRERATKRIVELGFDGIAVGGETIGYNMTATSEVMSWLHQLIPADKPRYAMGLGRDPQNIIDAVMAGFDMFDCVAPTRLARNGALYFGEVEQVSGKIGAWTFVSPYQNGRLQIGRAEFGHDSRVIQPGCDCATCEAGYSRAYLHHLYKTKELSYYRLASVHNVRTMLRITERLRQEIVR